MSHTSSRLCSEQLLREVSCFPASSEAPGATLVAHLQTGQHRRPGALSWTQHRPGLSSWSQPERAGLLLCPWLCKPWSCGTGAKHFHCFTASEDRARVGSDVSAAGQSLESTHCPFSKHRFSESWVLEVFPFYCCFP